MIDVAIVFAIFALWLFLLARSVQTIRNDESIDYAKSSLLGFCSYYFLFFCYESLLVAAANRTIGKAAMGLLIVNQRGRTQKCRAGLLRSVFKSIPFAVVTTLLGLARYDRRGAIDCAVGSTVIYAWDAQDFRVRQEWMDQGERLEDVHDEQDSDEDDGDNYNDVNEDKRHQCQGSMNTSNQLG